MLRHLDQDSRHNLLGRHEESGIHYRFPRLKEIDRCAQQGKNDITYTTAPDHTETLINGNLVVFDSARGAFYAYAPLPNSLVPNTAINPQYVMVGTTWHEVKAQETIDGTLYNWDAAARNYVVAPAPTPTTEPQPTATEAAPVVDAIMNPGVVGEMQPIDVQGFYTGGLELKPEYRAQAHQETKEAIVLSVENREYILQLLGLNSGSTEQAILSSMDTYLSEHNYQFPLVLQKEDGTEMVYKFLQGEVGPYANFPDNDDVNYINQMKSLGYINLDRSFFMSIDSSEFASNYHGIRDFFNNRPFKSVLFDATTPENSWRMMGLTLTDDHRLIQVVGTTTTQPKPDLPSWPRGNLIKHSNIDVNIQGKLATEWFDLYLYILRGSTDFDIDPALGNNNFKRKVIHAFRDYGETGIGFVSSEANNFQLIQD